MKEMCTMDSEVLIIDLNARIQNLSIFQRKETNLKYQQYAHKGCNSHGKDIANVCLSKDMVPLNQFLHNG